MKLNQEETMGQNHIRSFNQGSLVISDTTYTESVLVAPNLSVQLWGVSGLQDLKAKDLEVLLSYALAAKANVVLLGTGMQHAFVAPELCQAFMNKHIVVECMSTAAACRTYTVLSSESRAVVAALII